MSNENYVSNLSLWERRGALETLRALRRDIEPDGNTGHAAMFDVVEDALLRADRALTDCVAAAPNIEADVDFEGLHQDAERIGRDIDNLISELEALTARLKSREQAEVDGAVDGALRTLGRIRS